MKDKRISIRFRNDNETDMRAWNKLQELASSRNESKNSVIMECLLQSDINGDTKTDVNSEKIADMVADKIISSLGHLSLKDATCITPLSGESHTINQAKVEQREDEPELLNEDALDFLSSF